MSISYLRFDWYFSKYLVGRFLFPLLLAGLWIGGGCAGSSRIQQKIEPLLASEKYAKAHQLVEKNRSIYGSRDRVLWLLDRGTLLHYQGRHTESIDVFHEAERRIDELFQKSISEQAASLVVNDKVVTYAGEDFEDVMINVYKALSFAQLGNRESAQVESRKLNEKLNYIHSKRGGILKARYQEDAFARMLNGIFYEWGKIRSDINDALITNRNSFNLYQGKFGQHFGVGPPSALKANLLATAPILGRSQFKIWRDRFPEQKVFTLSQRRALATVYVFHFAGKAPIKEEYRIPYAIKNGLFLDIALPTYRTRDYRVHGSRILADDQLITTSEVVHPTGNIAIKNLEDHQPLIISKSVTRQIARYGVAGAIDKDAAQLFTALGNWILEGADLRSWRTLPDKILFAQFWLPAGEHKLQAELLDAQGKSVGKKELGKLSLPANSTRFLVFVTR